MANTPSTLLHKTPPKSASPWPLAIRQAAQILLAYGARADLRVAPWTYVSQSSEQACQLHYIYILLPRRHRVYAIRRHGQRSKNYKALVHADIRLQNQLKDRITPHAYFLGRV